MLWETGAADLRECFASIAARDCLLPLVGRQGWWPAHVDAPGLGAFSTFASSGSDQFALKLSEAAEHRQHEAAVGSSRVRPGIRERSEAQLGSSGFGGPAPHLVG